MSLLIASDPFATIAAAISVLILLTVLGRAVLALLRDWDVGSVDENDDYWEGRRKR